MCVLASISSATGGADGSDPITVGRGPGRYHGRADLDATPVALAAQETVPDMPESTPTIQSAVQEEISGETLAGGEGAASNAGSGVEALIRATFGEHGEEALKVGRCESGDDLHAESWENPNHRGPFQVSYVHAWRYAARGWDWDTATDAQHVMIALEIQQEQGWWPWRFSVSCHGVW